MAAGCSGPPSPVTNTSRFLVPKGDKLLSQDAGAGWAPTRLPSSASPPCCSEVFCTVTAHNPLIMGIKITQLVSKAAGFIVLVELLCSSGKSTPRDLCPHRAGEGRA